MRERALALAEIAHPDFRDELRAAAAILVVSVPELWIVRHGATEWSASGRHTGVSDIPLTDEGRAGARASAPVLARHRFALVLGEPARALPAKRPALAGFPDAVVDANLAEWNYGELEGLTSDEIRARGGDWSNWTIFTGAVPGGETIDQVADTGSRGARPGA